MRAEITRLMDRRDKISDFNEKLSELIGDEKKAEELIGELSRTTSTAYLENLRAQLEVMRAQLRKNSQPAAGAQSKSGSTTTRPPLDSFQR